MNPGLNVWSESARREYGILAGAVLVGLALNAELGW